MKNETCNGQKPDFSSAVLRTEIGFLGTLGCTLAHGAVLSATLRTALTFHVSRFIFQSQIFIIHNPKSKVKDQARWISKLKNSIRMKRA